MVRNYKRKTDTVYQWKTPRTRSWDKINEAKREEAMKLKQERLEANRIAYLAMLEEAKLEAEAIEAYMLTKKSQINHAI
ncbi:VP2 [Chicken proventriculitis-associated circular virus 17]|nr:VP2 [Chicken proventriculitis-associated circular virus 17]